MPIENIPIMIRDLYEIVRKLESLFPNRPFTPDGHLVGSIGEVLAEHHYDLKLLPPSHEGHDAKTKDGRFVQIKATQGKMVALRSNPEYLLVLKINKDGTISEIYNGPGGVVWEASGKLQKNGQRPISLSKLNILQISISEDKKLPIRNQFSSAVTADHCKVHNQKLVCGSADILYGYIDSPINYGSAKIETFPNSNSYVYGGCCVSGISPKKINVMYCKVCRENEKKWKKKANHRVSGQN